MLDASTYREAAAEHLAEANWAAYDRDKSDDPERRALATVRCSSHLEAAALNCTVAAALEEPMSLDDFLARELSLAKKGGA